MRVFGAFWLSVAAPRDSGDNQFWLAAIDSSATTASITYSRQPLHCFSGDRAANDAAAAEAHVTRNDSSLILVGKKTLSAGLTIMLQRAEAAADVDGF
jgi:hypothetical protein